MTKSLKTEAICVDQFTFYPIQRDSSILAKDTPKELIKLRKDDISLSNLNKTSILLYLHGIDALHSFGKCLRGLFKPALIKEIESLSGDFEWTSVSVKKDMFGNVTEYFHNGEYSLENCLFAGVTYSGFLGFRRTTKLYTLMQPKSNIEQESLNNFEKALRELEEL